MGTDAAVWRHRNETQVLTGETENLLRLIDEDRLEELQERSAQELVLDNAAQPLRDLEERRRAALTSPDGMEPEAEKLAEEYREVVASVRTAPVRRPRVDWAVSGPAERAADGAFVWSTTTLVPMPGAFDVSPRPEGGYVFTGRRRSVDSTFLSFEVILRGHFWLGVDHLPPSTSGVWVSHPSVDLRGNVWAETQRGSTEAWCSLYRTQTLFQLNGGQVVPLGTRHAESLLVRSVSLNSVVKVLDGLFSLPVLEFAPQHADKPVWATLEVRFAGKVKGRTAEVELTGQPPLNGVVLQIPSWRAVPY